MLWGFCTNTKMEIMHAPSFYRSLSRIHHMTPLTYTGANKYNYTHRIREESDNQWTTTIIILRLFYTWLNWTLAINNLHKITESVKYPKKDKSSSFPVASIKNENKMPAPSLSALLETWTNSIQLLLVSPVWWRHQSCLWRSHTPLEETVMAQWV